MSEHHHIITQGIDMDQIMRLGDPKSPSFHADLSPKSRAGWGKIPLIFSLVISMGCVSIPRAAPELSMSLGTRIEAIQKSHLSLLGAFFDEKRKQVDRFLNEEWLPAYAEEVFSDARVQGVWRQVIASDAKDADRLKFLMIYGPRIQSVLDQKRRELRGPLDELERTLERHLRNDYGQAKEMNTRLTSMLESAAKLSERQDAVREKLGVSSDKFSSCLNDVDGAVAKLLDARSKGENAASSIHNYYKKLEEMITKAK